MPSTARNTAQLTALEAKISELSTSHTALLGQIARLEKDLSWATGAELQDLSFHINKLKVRAEIKAGGMRMLKAEVEEVKGRTAKLVEEDDGEVWPEEMAGQDEKWE